MKYRLEAIRDILKGRMLGDGSLACTDIALDTRTITHAEGTLFVAIRGAQHDGHNFVKEAYRAGVRMFILEDATPLNEELTNANNKPGVVVVEDSLAGLQTFAAAHRRQFLYPVVGVTGSNGKTIVKEWATHIIDTQLSTIRNPRSYNSQVGVPLSVLLMENVHQVAIFEAGISQRSEMNRLKEILEPNIGVLTNIGKAHQENFASSKEKLQEKLKLFSDVDMLIYCQDQEEVHQQVVEAFSEDHLMAWSMQNSTADVFYQLKKQKGKTVCKASFYGNVFAFTLPFTSSALVEDALHAITLSAALNIPAEVIQKSAARLPQIAMRLEMVQGIHDCTLINDSYNSDLNSLAIALNLLVQQNQHDRKTLILSDILQK